MQGRLGLETARIPQADRHGLLWLSMGNLTVENGTLRFLTAGGDSLDAGDYSIPFQLLSCIILQPGCTISHDALRLCARHGTGIVVAGQYGVRLYASMPFGPDDSLVARRQVSLWSDLDERTRVARRMYALRFGEVLPDENLNVLRGIEGCRAKVSYQVLASKFGIEWHGRNYDRSNPDAADLPNQAINHAAAAVQATALMAVAVTGAIPQLGFIHEDSGNAFCLDIADLFRDLVTLPVAFSAVREFLSRAEPGLVLERVVRRHAGLAFRKCEMIPSMIKRIKELLELQ